MKGGEGIRKGRRLVFPGVRDTSDNSVTGGGNPEGKKVSVPIRDTSDYSVTGGGGGGG